MEHNPAQGWSNRPAAAGAASGAHAYASPGYGSLPENGDSFSIFKVFSFALGMLFSFQGRIGRSEYWTIGIIRFVIFLVAIFGYVRTLQPITGDMDSMVFMRGFVESTSGVMFLILFLALTVCLYSLEVRRLHDRNASGFWILIMFIPIIGAFYALWLFIANGFFAGTPGQNRFDTAHSQAAVFD